MLLDPPSVLLIRADGGPAVGHGHVMRCLALAQAWQRAGGTAVFVQAETPAGLVARLGSEGIASRSIGAAPGSDADAAETVRHARELSAAWVVADGYRLGPAWQERVVAAGFKLLALDDHGHLPSYPATVVLNQNLSASPDLYPSRRPGERILLGNRFALLRGDFRPWRSWSRATPPRARRILVTLGGSDPDNATALALEALALLPGMQATVVVGGSNPHLDALRQAAARRPDAIRLVVDAQDMPKLMAEADIALAAAGSTAWELAFMGLPSALIVLADNQAGIASALHAAGASLNLGNFRELTPEAVARQLSLLIDDEGKRRELSRKARVLVDGRGAERVVAALGGRLALAIVSDEASWLNPDLAELAAGFEADGHRVCRLHDPADLGEGDIALFLSLGRLVPPEILRRHAHNLVVHESELPAGRGWSPLTWQILEGRDEIPVTLFEAAENVDSGDIYSRETLRFDGGELVGELRAAQAAATLRLCRAFVRDYPFSLSTARPQAGPGSTYPRRRPADSRLDPDKTLREQFNLLRVADPDRYPAYFELAGRTYRVRVTSE